MLGPPYAGCALHGVRLWSAVQGYPVKKIVEYAIAEGFTNLLVFNEDQKAVNGLLMVHLPGGPTAHFKLSSIVLSKAIKVGLPGEV